MKQINCERCGKVLEGYTEKQMNYLLAQHQLAKHPGEAKNPVASTPSTMSRQKAT